MNLTRHVQITIALGLLITILPFHQGVLIAKKIISSEDRVRSREFFQTGLVHMSSTDVDSLWSAKDAFTKAIQLDPYFMEAFAKLAILHLDLNDSLQTSFRNLKKAFELARHVIELSPESPLGYQVMADILQEVGQYEEAEQFIKKALYFNKNDPDTLFVYGKIKMIQEPEKAAQLLLKAIELSKDPSRFVPFFILATDRFEDEEQRISMLMELKKTFPQPEVLNALGEAFSRLGKYELVVEQYDLSLKADPNDLRTIINSAIITYLKLKNYQKAEMALKTALNKPQLVQESLNKAIIYGHLGIIKLFQQQIPDALALFKQAITLEPSSTTLVNAISFAFLDKKLYEDSLKFYTIAIDVAPNVSQYYALKATTLSQYLKRYDESIPLLDRALEIDPDVEQYHSEKGFAYYYLSKYKLALASFDNAIKLNPEDGLNHYNKSCVLSLMNRKDEAVKELKTAFKFAPELIQHAKNDPDLKNIRGDNGLKDLFDSQF